MSLAFEIAAYLVGLPKRVIKPLPVGTAIPKITSSGKLTDYNGFTAQERLRTFEISKWLIKSGAMQHSGYCSICGAPADQQHAEDYFDLETWMDICRGCHSSLHGRFRTPAAWDRRVASFALDADHWAKALPTFQIDVAAFHRSSGRPEPTAAEFVIPADG